MKKPGHGGGGRVPFGRNAPRWSAGSTAQVHTGKELVQAITSQTCLKASTVYQLLRVLELEEKVLLTQNFL